MPPRPTTTLRAHPTAVVIALAVPLVGLPVAGSYSPATAAKTAVVAADPPPADGTNERPDAISAMVSARVLKHRVEDASQLQLPISARECGRLVPCPFLGIRIQSRVLRTASPLPTRPALQLPIGAGKYYVDR